MLGPAVADYPTGARMVARVIDDCEFVWMLRGSARFVTDGEPIRLSPGRLLLVPPGVRHSFTWDEEGPSRHGYVHFDPVRIGRSAFGRPMVLRMTSRDPLQCLCAYLLWLGRERPDSWRRAADDVLRLLVALFADGPMPAAEDAPAFRPALIPAIAHLRRQWAHMPLRRITVDELAVAASLSRSHLTRCFRAEFAMSPASALEHLRCTRAETLLARTTLTATAIARHCGYADLYHFSHRFRELHGRSPTRYRAATSPPSLLDKPGVRRLAHAVWDQ